MFGTKIKCEKSSVADPGREQSGSGMEKSRIRDKHPGSATLSEVSRSISGYVYSTWKRWKNRDCALVHWHWPVYHQYFMQGYTHTSWSSDSLIRSTTCARRVRSGLDLAVRLGKSHTRRFSRPSHRRTQE